MLQFQKILKIATESQELVDITQTVRDAVAESGIATGLCTVFVRHTSASLIIQENADPDVLLDLKDFMARLAPEGASYRHTSEGSDDMPSHIRSILTKTTETIPFSQGRLLLGRWQGVFLWEHRTDKHVREVVIHLVGQ